MSIIGFKKVENQKIILIEIIIFGHHLVLLMANKQNRRIGHLFSVVAAGNMTNKQMSIT